MKDDITRTLDFIKELEDEKNIPFDGAVKLLTLLTLEDINNTLEDISGTIDRLGDNLTNSIDAIEEDARTGKVFIKGEVSAYTLN